jgi:hypothetical protein
MSFKTNPYLEKIEKRHAKMFLIINIIISLALIAFGLWYLLNFKEDANEDKLVPIVLIASGVLDLLCTLLLKIFKK